MASAMHAIVDAVPIDMQCPTLRAAQPSRSSRSSLEISPARASSLLRQRSVPDPSCSAPQCALSCGPPVSMIVGKSTLAAPISWAGVVLSQPESSTTPSTGLARRVSSTSIDIRLRKNMAVGRTICSPREMVGNSSGRPPDSHTPRFTDSAIPRKWELQGVSSDQLLAMPITGRPSATSRGRPSIKRPERWMIPSRSCFPNHSLLRKGLGTVSSLSFRCTRPALAIRSSRVNC